MAIGEGLGALVSSQRRQLDLGVRKSVELQQLVKRYHQRWNSVKGRVEKRQADIKVAMVKYDPANLGVTSEFVCDFFFLICFFVVLFCFLIEKRGWGNILFITMWSSSLLNFSLCLHAIFG